MKRVLILGGTKGLGAVIAQQCEADGWTVQVVGRSQPYVWDPATAPRCDALVLCQRFRGVSDAWAGEIATSLSLTKHFIEWAAAWSKPTRSVVTISSVSARFVLPEQPLGYHAAKAAMEAMVRYYAVKFGPVMMRVNAVAPGAFVKPESVEYFAAHPEISDVFTKSPLGRMVTAAEIAGVVRFLLSDQASAITGQTITVDGGFSLLGQESLARGLVI